MTSIFLFIGVASLAILYLLLFKKRTTLFSVNSIDTDAVILNIQLTGVCIKSEMQAIVQLQVLPERGKSFVIEVKELFTAAEYTQVSPGSKILVKHELRNHKEVLIIKESFSRTFR
ncbi:MAG: hypothetical protein ABIT58_03075 [Ferruginibacter sp.]